MKLTKKNYILIAVSVLVVGAFALGGYLWNSQVKNLKINRDTDAQMIQELEKKLNNKNSAINEDGSPNWVDNQTYEPTDKDIVEINKFQVEKCSPAVQRDGAITRENLSKDSRFYNGYARVSIACREVGESGGSGYVSFMKRQPDGSWDELFGTQEAPSCPKISQYKIPQQIAPTCVDEKGDQQSNTN